MTQISYSKSKLEMLRSSFFALLKRWAPSRIKKLVWENEFRSGKWLHSNVLKRPAICEWVERYCRGGIVLDLGCAEGVVGFTLNEARYSAYIGVDISEIAIAHAAARCSTEFVQRKHKTQFVVQDISTYTPPEAADVILFRQSLYYFNASDLRKMLEKYRGHLVNYGVMVVVMDDVKRHQWIIDYIAKHFDVFERTMLGDVIILVFR